MGDDEDFILEHEVTAGIFFYASDNWPDDDEFDRIPNKRRNLDRVPNRCNRAL